MKEKHVFNIKYRGKVYTLTLEKNRINSQEILEFLGLSKEYAFVVKNGEIVLSNGILSPEDEIEVINAVSGG
ncbi:MAG: MoaD/ThiS family protein [Dictyoglomaceae bacterium]